VTIKQDHCEDCGQSEYWTDLVLSQQKLAWCRTSKHDIPLKCLNKLILCCVITHKSLARATPAVKAWEPVNYVSE
jgi:hypothetical protein